MRFHEFCLFVCTTPALGMVALKLEKDFDVRFLLYYFLSPSLFSLSPTFFLPPFSSLFPLPLLLFLSFRLHLPLPQVFRILLCREVASVLSFFPYAISY